MDYRSQLSRATDITRSEEPFIQHFDGALLGQRLIDHEYHAAVFGKLLPLLRSVGGAGDYITSELDILHVDIRPLSFHSKIFFKN